MKKVPGKGAEQLERLEGLLAAGPLTSQYKGAVKIELDKNFYTYMTRETSRLRKRIERGEKCL